ncbi:MAG: glycosyltransferase family 39 protein [Polyangiales bacterium]
METVRPIARAVPLVAFLAAALLLLTGLTASGIWDPWELDVAVRIGSNAAVVERPPLADSLVALGLDVFGRNEWSGRLPLAIAGLFVVSIAMGLARRTSDGRGAAYAAIVAATTPLLLANSRSMLGESDAMAAQALVGLLAIEASFPRGNEGRARAVRLAALVALPFAIALAASVRGVLVGALPPLLAVASVLLVDGRLLRPRESKPLVEGLVVTLALGLLALVASAVLADRAEYRALLGGVPRGGNPPSFESGLSTLFLSFAPYSPLALLASARALSTPAGEDDDDRDVRAIELVLVAWIAFAYAAGMVFGSRYGTPAYLAVAPLAVLVAGYARAIERSTAPARAAAVFVALVVGLLFRDYAIYPSSPLSGLPVPGLAVPDTFHPRGAWAATMLGFAGLAALGLVASPTPRGDSDAAPAPGAPERRLRARFDALGSAFRFALVALGVVLVALNLASVAALLLGDALPLPSLAIRALRAIVPVELALVGVVVAGPKVLALFSELRDARLAPAMVAGLAFGLYVQAGFLPRLGADFSPREVYETYNALRAPNDRLAVFRLGTRAAPYYAHGPVDVIASQPEVVQHLLGTGRRWAVIPREDLMPTDQAFRIQSQRHLFVADARSARVLLVTNTAIRGRTDQNPIALAVRRTAPTPRFPSHARFGTQIELIGYDLELPHRDYVGAGESFAITWYYRALAEGPFGYQVFLHIDGFGLRLNGDHVPANGLVPLAQWTPGDIIVDRQELTVPSNFRPGSYTMFLGFFSGETRLPVTEGQQDGANRVVAGRLHVR